MKKMFIMIMLVSQTAFSEVVVVANKNNVNDMNAEYLSRLFLGKTKTFPDGSTAIPVAQAESAPSTEEFNAKIIGRSSRQLKAYWSQLVFTGKGTPPREIPSDAEVIKLVKDNPNIIGYISSASVDPSVKVIGTF